MACAAVIAAITTDAPAAATPGPVGAAVALGAVLPQTDALTPHEQALMRDWLHRTRKPPRRRAANRKEPD